MLLLDEPAGQPVVALAFSADGQRLASVARRSHLIRIWNLATHELEFTLTGNTGRVVAIAFAPSGEYFASASFAGALWLWECDLTRTSWRGAMAHHWPRSPGVHAPGQLAFSPDSSILASTQCRLPLQRGPRRYAPATLTQIALVEPVTAQVRWLETGHTEDVSSVAFSPDGTTVATGSFDRTVRLHQLGKRARSVMNLHEKVHFLTFAGDGLSIAAASARGLVRVFDTLSTGERLHLFAEESPLHALCFSPDGRTLASAAGQQQGVVSFWEVQTGSRMSSFDWNIGEIHSMAFAPDGMRACAGGDGKIMVWDIDDWC
ncbi:MAG: WD40 repeat domain-containing protein [Gemmataceae bacterium]